MIPDSNQLNEELLAEWLCEIIHREVSKPDDEADMELVEECEKTLLSLSNSTSVSEDELRERLNRIISNEKVQDASQHKQLFRLIHRAAAIAACAAVFLFAGVMTVYAFVPSFQSFVREVLNLQTGTSIEHDGITYINNGESKIYSSLDELLEGEGLYDLNIILPNNLPRELMISGVRTVSSDIGEELDVMFVDEGVSMSIENRTDINMAEIIESSERVEINGITAYINGSDGLYVMVSILGSHTYYITADSKDKIITILENMNSEDLK